MSARARIRFHCPICGGRISLISKLLSGDILRAKCTRCFRGYVAYQGEYIGWDLPYPWATLVSVLVLAATYGLCRTLESWVPAALALLLVPIGKVVWEQDMELAEVWYQRSRSEIFWLMVQVAVALMIVVPVAIFGIAVLPWYVDYARTALGLD